MHKDFGFAVMAMTTMYHTVDTTVWFENDYLPTKGCPILLTMFIKVHSPRIRLNISSSSLSSSLIASPAPSSSAFLIRSAMSDPYISLN